MKNEFKFLFRVLVIFLAALILVKNIKIQHDGKLETQNSHHGTGWTPIQISNR